MKKILIVEDNPANLRLLKMALKGESCAILEATNGEDAIRIAMDQTPDIIVMDIQLPKMDGYEATRHLREKNGFSRIPIIALTAHAMKGDEEKALQSGFDRYVSKPIDVTMFRSLIRAYLAG